MSDVREQALQRITAEYGAKGYRVVAPTPDDLPDFLRGAPLPDLIAYGPEGNIVFEVKSARGRDISPLLERLGSEPSWKLAVVIPRAEEDEVVPLANAARIRAQLEEPITLIRGGQSVAAVLVAWSLFEAAARLRMASTGADPTKGFPQSALIRQLIHLGHLEQEDLPVLTELARTRNRAAHGDLTVFVDEAALRELRAATERLLGPARAA